jgi:hypothetical protein
MTESDDLRYLRVVLVVVGSVVDIRLVIKPKWRSHAPSVVKFKWRALGRTLGCALECADPPFL